MRLLVNSNVMSKKGYSVKEHRDASDRLSIHFDQIAVRLYDKITQAIVERYELKPVSEVTRGLDEKFQDFAKDNKVVGLEWDIWSGYIVTAKVPMADDLVREIASFVSERYENS